MQITSEAIQRWVRVALYVVFGGLGQVGLSLGATSKEFIISAVGLAATAAWTKYGSSLGSMLSEVGKTEGVKEAVVRVDTIKIPATDLNRSTPNTVSVKAA